MKEKEGRVRYREIDSTRDRSKKKKERKLKTWRIRESSYLLPAVKSISVK